MNPVVVYWLDLRPGNLSYLKMCQNSIASLRRHEPDLPIRVLSPERIEHSFDRLKAEIAVVDETFTPERDGLHPRYSKYSVLDADFGEHDFALVLDTDTFINGPLRPLCEAHVAADFSARPETGNSEESLERFNRWIAWAKIRLVRNPTWQGDTYFNSGVYLVRSTKARSVAKALRQRLDDNTVSPVQFGDTDHFPSGDSENNVKAAMIEEARFSDAVRQAGLSVDCLSRQEHGFLWELDLPTQSVVFHTGGGVQYNQYLHQNRHLKWRP